MQYILAVSLFFIAAFLVIFSVYAVKFRPLSQISIWFSALMLALTLYAAGYGGELLSPALNRMIFWNTVQYLGISFIPFLWITLAAQYTNAAFIRSRFIRILLFVLSCISLFGALTDPCFHLKYAYVRIGMEPGFPVLEFTRGPLYYFQGIYMLLSLVTGIVLLVHSLLSTGRTFRKAILFMTLGASLPLVDYMLYLMNIKIPGIDTIPFSMFFSVLCSGIAIFSEKLLDAVPVARSLVFEMMPDAVIVVNCRNRIADYNKAACRLFPDIADGVNPIPALPKTNAIPENNEFRTNILCNGKICKFSCHVTDIIAAPKQHEPQGKIFLFKDITESMHLLEKMKELAALDPLTKLYNRRYFMDQAEKMTLTLKRTKGTLSFIIADLDLFKQINDTRGHLAGDEVIQAVADIFITNIQPPNIAARFGGEEFICLLPNTDADAAFVIAELIRKKIEQIPFPPDSRNQDMPVSDHPAAFKKAPYITASLGVASTRFVSNEHIITELEARADKALYESKNEGRNRTTIG